MTAAGRAAPSRDRSRRSREALVEAALTLCAQAEDVEAVTVEQIAEAAGLTRRSFYSHFTGKQDVLLELNRTTDDAMADLAAEALDAGTSIDATLARVVAELDKRSRRLPRQVQAQIVAEYHRDPALMRERSAFRQLLPQLFEQARTRGELPAGADPERLARLAAAILQSSTQAWAEGRTRSLRADLDYGFRVLLSGARAQ